MKTTITFLLVALLAGSAFAVVHDVEISNFQFEPSQLTIDVGDTVRWENHDTAPHTATSTTGVFDSGTLMNDDIYSFAFTNPGEFPYFCEIHPSMTATIIVLGQTGVEDDIEELLPSQLALDQNYPNPFNASTTISFAVSAATDARLEIYDITGRLVNTLLDGSVEAGEHSVVWDASDYATGVYFYRLETAEKTETRSMALLK